MDNDEKLVKTRVKVKMILFDLTRRPIFIVIPKIERLLWTLMRDNFN